MLLLIDNYDSFTYNLVHYLGELGADVQVRRNDALSWTRRWPCAPTESCCRPAPAIPTAPAICLPLIDAAAKARLPLMGVCLGHQSIGPGLRRPGDPRAGPDARQGRRHPA